MLKLLSASVSLFAAACVADPGATATGDLTLVDGTPAVHMLPMHTGGAVANAAPPNAHLND
ncbi:MAG TPA: hypothetical protein VGD37_31780, partial [Kofleriaceae bacterium]